MEGVNGPKALSMCIRDQLQLPLPFTQIKLYILQTLHFPAQGVS